MPKYWGPISLLSTSLLSASTAVVLERRRASEKSLLVHLRLFAKLAKPRRFLDVDGRLRAGVFLDLLDSASAEVQKAALDCIFAYKESFVNPYRENLERFVDVKTFRTELALFSMDDETASVLEVRGRGRNGRNGGED